MLKSASKNGWIKHRFDEMAVVVNDRIDDPAKADVEYYVGLEHLDSESLAIRRWGAPSDVGATKLRFRAGDIIFGRRRVYQRKLAVADFDGICSAHAMVLRAKPAVALPEFLPFFHAERPLYGEGEGDFCRIPVADNQLEDLGEGRVRPAAAGRAAADC